jgi:geranylgeranyl pyrophosphate synthase
VTDRPSLDHFLSSTRQRINDALDRALPRPPASPPLLFEAMRYSLLGGGKRLRPILVLAAADAVARRHHVADPDDAVPAACAVEMIHTYSLIHDDLPSMDNDTLRRGRPTLHVVYGEGVAILAGDALQAEAFALLAREPLSSDAAVLARKLRVSAAIASAAGSAGMVGGQTIDLQAAGQVAGHALTLDGDGLRAMHQRKTGALIVASAAAGAIMGGADDAALDAVNGWAREIGLAFQIVDDILDVEGNAAELGKTAGKDAAGDKPTYVSLFGLDTARAMAASCAERARECLDGAGLTDSWLPGIAEWVLTRRN